MSDDSGEMYAKSGLTYGNDSVKIRKVGKVKYSLNDETIYISEIKSGESVEKISYFQILKRVFSCFILK